MSTTENPAGANGGAQNDSPTTECCETRRIYSQCQEASFKLEDAPPTAPEDGEQTPTALRLELKARGYSPIPLYGKEPPIYGVNNAHGGLAGWQKLRDIPVGKIEAWDRKWPDADNTGILTYCTPTFDIDMMHAAAADAVEALARERFGARGRILIRTGQAPKRAIPLRTETPFAKKKRVFTAPDGSEHKIEILCDGQQLVTRGIHPDTKQPYTWTGGEPWTVDRSELPEISEAAAIAFLNAASEFLIEQFGFKPKSDEKADTGDGGPSHDWEEPISNILSGVDLHDSIAVLAMKMIVSGMSPGAAVNMLRTLMKQSNVKGDDDNFTRYAERYDDIPRAVDTAVNKVGREEAKPASIKSKLMQSSAVFVGNYVPPDYLVDGLLQRRYVYSFTGPTGSGKTAIVLRLAAHVARGLPLGGRQVEKGRVLFFAGENPEDVRSRWVALCEQMKVDADSIDVTFMPFALNLSDAKIRQRIDAEAAEHGPFNLLIVDTSAAYYSGDNENDNVQLGNHARMLRTFVNLPGGPTVLVTCHPTKTADMSNLLPRGAVPS